MTDHPDMLAYARALQGELDDFTTGIFYHQVAITYSRELIECVIELVPSPAAIEPGHIREGMLTMAELLAELPKGDRPKIIQQVYTPAGARLFDGSRMYIYKATVTANLAVAQASNDATRLIGSALQVGKRRAKNNK